MSVPSLILASRSPRRAELLRDAGYPFTQADPPFADPPAPAAATGAAPPGLLAIQLAAAKGRSLLGIDGHTRDPASVILAADTIVVAPDGSLLGQPADRDQSRAMLAALVGQTHRVVTGVVLLAANAVRGLAFADTATVSLGPVEPAALTAYLDGHGWRGKAGAYNLAELEHRWPFTVAGDPATVVGLPMAKLAAVLAVWPDVAAGLNAIHGHAPGVH